MPIINLFFSINKSEISTSTLIKSFSPISYIFIIFISSFLSVTNWVNWQGLEKVFFVL